MRIYSHGHESYVAGPNGYELNERGHDYDLAASCLSSLYMCIVLRVKGSFVQKA